MPQKVKKVKQTSTKTWLKITKLYLDSESQISLKNVVKKS